jgi:hypothetical protein
MSVVAWPSHIVAGNIVSLVDRVIFRLSVGNPEIYLIECHPTSGCIKIYRMALAFKGYVTYETESQ